jgi:hypothetical protein
MILYAADCGRKEQIAECRQKKMQQQLESYAKQNIDHEEKMRTILQRLEVVKKQKSGKASFCC